MSILWKCHCCGGEFPTLGGGLCDQCGKPTCSRCFGMGTIRNMLKSWKRRAQTCRSCREAKERESAVPGS